jgi:hypothetical protein
MNCFAEAQTHHRIDSLKHGLIRELIVKHRLVTERIGEA